MNIIDLTNIDPQHEDRIADHIYQEVIKSNTDIDVKFNYIIMSVAIFNIIECHKAFHSPPTSSVDDVLTGLTFVGILGEFNCYVDIYCPANELSVQYDKQISRNNKIESILNDLEIINSVRLMVNF